MGQTVCISVTLNGIMMSDHIPEDINDTIDIDDIEEIEILPLPLDAWHRERGARMVEFAGYHMPIQYEGIMAEHSWTRTNAGLFDVSHMGLLHSKGWSQAIFRRWQRGECVIRCCWLKMAGSLMI
jgi:Aminomethyltransferase folate-binding domain